MGSRSKPAFGHFTLDYHFYILQRRGFNGSRLLFNATRYGNPTPSPLCSYIYSGTNIPMFFNSISLWEKASGP